MPKVKKLNLKSRMRLRYHQIRLATMDALQRQRLWSRSGQNGNEDSEGDEDFEDDDESQSDLDSDSEACADVSNKINGYSPEKGKVGGGILNLNRFYRTSMLGSDERVKKYVEGDGSGCRSFDKAIPGEGLKFQSYSIDGRKTKESRHVSFRDELPRLRFSADSICRRKPSTTRTVSSDESLTERRALLKLKGSSERKQRLFSTKHNAPPQAKFNTEIQNNKSEGIQEEEEENLTDEHKFQLSLENFYKICESLPIQEQNKSRDLSPGEIVSSSELDGPVVQPSASRQSLSIHSCESCPQSACVSEDDDEDVSSSLTESRSDSESESKHSVLPSPGSRDVLQNPELKAEKPKKHITTKVTQPSTKSNNLSQEEDSMFRKFGRFVEQMFAQNKKMFLNATGADQSKAKPISNSGESNVEQKSTNQNDSKFQLVRDKVIALGNRKRDPVKLNKPTRKVEFGMKIVLNSSPVRNSRAKTIQKRQKTSQEKSLESQTTSSKVTSLPLPTEPRKITDGQYYYKPKTSTDFQNDRELKFNTENKDSSGGIFTKFIHEMFIQPPNEVDKSDRYFYPPKSSY